MRRGNLSLQRGKVFLFASAIVIVIALVLLGGVLGTVSISTEVLITGTFLFLVVLALRQYELAVVMIVIIHIYMDWFLGKEIVGTVVALVLLLLLFLIRSPQYPWVMPGALWLWCLFLVIALPPTIRGSRGNYELAFYYPSTILGAFVMFWLGMLAARDKMHLKTFFQMLAGLGTLLAIHTIIQATTGRVVFGTSGFDTYLAQVSNFMLSSSASRAGSFFLNPDWNGTFFAVVFFIPLGLFAEASSLLLKFLYFVLALLMLIALLFTYSLGAWIGALAGILTFALFVGRRYYHLLIPILMIIAGALLMLIFPTEINLLLQRLSNPNEVALRSGAWQTAISVIRAFPLTGVGLGPATYLQMSQPYRSRAQYIPLAHPHDSYLEWGAEAGLPVLIVFLALLLYALWQAWRNWKKVDTGTRCLLGAGIASVIAISINSLSINGWTLPPLATLSWLILGSLTSPLVRRAHAHEAENDT